MGFVMDKITHCYTY